MRYYLYYLIQILSILHSLYIILNNKDSIIYYINNYIDKNQLG